MPAEEPEKVPSGVEGLDEMLGGGFPKNHMIVVMGSFGTGKTTLALQFLLAGLQQDEGGLFISLEEDCDSILRSAASFGWDLQPYVGKKKLAVVKLEPSDAKTTITRIKSELPKFIKNFGADRVVLDSVSLLSTIIPNEQEKRATIFTLCELIRSSGATAILTAETKDDNPQVSRDGLVEYTADGVILLRADEPQEASEIRLTIRILKMRRTAHSRRVKPYQIGPNGLTVLAGAEVF